MPPSKITEKIIKIVQQGIYQWSSDHPRPMPWKGIKDPYKIWISEIILQQTRVEQGWSYYQKFIVQFPTVQSLADAEVQAVLHMWQGLGYYSRARNLHLSAQWIMNNNRGIFPATIESIKQLKGVGEYTAAAIASFAYDLPHAVLDGNVHRILSRYFGIRQVMQSTRQKRYFQELADQLLDRTHPASYNQAIMDFGARCCTPKLPACAICPLQPTCFAYQKNVVSKYPPPKKKIEKKIRHFHYLVALDKKGKVVIHRRTGQDIWNGLFEFILIETGSDRRPGKIILEKILGETIHLNKPVLVQSQTLSHRIIYGYFYIIRSGQKRKDALTVSVGRLKEYPFPGIIAKNLDLLMEQMIQFK